MEEFDDDERRAITAYLKERVYATFTGLAITLVLLGEFDHIEPGRAFGTLALGVLGITIAGLLADIVAHVSVHGALPSRLEFRLELRIASGALGTAVLPLLLIAAAWLGWLDLHDALRIDSFIYLATLGLIGYLAVRRSTLKPWAKLVALSVFVVFGGVVIGIQILAHGG
ncbi:hypothetical protein [Agromyces mangrovi Wang et al. 2018]|uniref:hypothetical protein n=1 Tax=Agromyces mangrovi TaxID=1858653 RepID=UPI0025727F2D|nr:hypothetical protein [Agromyces mangrovi]BDZ64475.1 hypothetical protein GCM10025877_14130 [Agromyces mangrovi]